MTTKKRAATISNYLWIHKDSVEGTPEEFAPSWQFEIKLLKTAKGRMQQQQISAMREQFGDDLDIDDISENDVFILRNWTEVGNWWALSCGDEEKVKALCKKLGLKLKDKRVQAPWADEVRNNLELYVDLRDYQVEPYNQWAKADHGLFHAKPGFGKTILMIKDICRIQQNTLVLVHTDALATQFMDRFRKGSPDGKGGFMKLTNCEELEADLGYPIIGRYRTKGKWDPKGDKPAAGPTFPVTVATWQSFLSLRGRAALKEISEKTGVVLCDEAHVFAAPKAGGIVNTMKARYRKAVSAIPERKDLLDVALYDIVGPITAKGFRPQLPTTATMIATGIVYKPSSYAKMGEWAYLLNALCKSAARNDIIYEWVKHDLNSGRKLLMLSDRVQWCKDFSIRLNKAGFRSAVVIGGMSADQRDKVISDMMNNQIDVICATKVFKEGVDIPCLDTMHAICPMSNKPLLDNMIGRITRSYPGKKEPLFRYYVDEGSGLVYGCAKGTAKHLVELDIDVVTIEQGTKPGEKKSADGYNTNVTGNSNTRAKKSGLRRASDKSPSAVTKLFEDITKADRASSKYIERMKGKGK